MSPEELEPALKRELVRAAGEYDLKAPQELANAGLLRGERLRIRRILSIFGGICLMALIAVILLFCAR
jgi:hypothetical protein